MIKISTASVAATLLLATSFSAQAADMNYDDKNNAKSDKTVYFALRLGTSFQDDTSFDLNSAAAVPTAIDNVYQNGKPTGSAAIGMSFMERFRGEVEFSHNEESIKSHTLVAVPATLSDDDAFGTTSITSVMVNGAVDYDFGGFGVFGTAGVGNSWVDFQNHGVVVPTGGVAGLPAGAITAMDSKSSALTWQVGGGFNVDLSADTTLELGYRYKSIEGVSLTAVDGTQTDVDLTSHNLYAGFRVAAF